MTQRRHLQELAKILINLFAISPDAHSIRKILCDDQGGTIYLNYKPPGHKRKSISIEIPWEEISSLVSSQSTALVPVPKGQGPKLKLDAQDHKFLKALKIAVDEEQP